MAAPLYNTATYVAGLAEALLASAAASVVTNPAPTRQYVSFGEPAWDCDQLAVWVSRIFPAAIGTRRGVFPEPGPDEPCGIRAAAEFGVTLLRCDAPGVTGTLDGSIAPPTAAVLTAHTRALNIDGWELFQGLVTRWSAGTLLGNPDPIPCSLTSVGTLTPFNPSGGIAGWTMKIVSTLA